MIDEIACILGPCLESFSRDPAGLLLSFGFGAVVLLSIYMIIRNPSPRSRIRWSYPLVFGFLFVLSYFSFTMACHANLPFCAERAFMWGFPIGAIGSILFGYVILPCTYLAYQRGMRSDALSGLLPEPGIPVYIADKGKPFAFSYGGFRKWIVVSQGMIDILSKKELEAVLLHEYAHISSNSSLYRASGWLYSRMPLLHAFFDCGRLEDSEEKDADSSAVAAQGTDCHLLSAKRKLKGYFGC